jgi:hypothetical protein
VRPARFERATSASAGHADDCESSRIEARKGRWTVASRSRAAPRVASLGAAVFARLGQEWGTGYVPRCGTSAVLTVPAFFQDQTRLGYRVVNAVVLVRYELNRVPFGKQFNSNVPHLGILREPISEPSRL